MFVRNNTATPCCGEDGPLNLSFGRLMIDDNSAELVTSCPLCCTTVQCYVSFRLIYEKIRKGMILLPSTRSEFRFSRWPVYGPVFRKAYYQRLISAWRAFSPLDAEFDLDILTNPYLAKLAWQIQALFLASGEVNLRKCRPSALDL